MWRRRERRLRLLLLLLLLSQETLNTATQVIIKYTALTTKKTYWLIQLNSRKRFLLHQPKAEPSPQSRLHR
jgi:hypothetical protein